MVGRRPAVVLSRDAVLDRLAEPLVAFVTTVVRDVPTEVILDQIDGLPRLCAVALDTVQPIRRGLLVERLSHLSQQRLEEVCQALAAATGCEHG